MFKHPCVVVALVLLLSGHALAELKLAPLFTDNAVLQRDKPVTVWGWADPDATVAVSFHDKTQQAVADHSGAWHAVLPAMPASDQPADLTVSAGQRVTLKNVVVGDVWLCSGQSNMEWHVRDVTNADAEIATADLPMIRQYRVPHVMAGDPQTQFDPTNWVPASPKSVISFTAVGYFFAREIHQSQHVPIGLINGSWGGKMIEVFMSPESLAGRPEFKSVFDRYVKEREATTEHAAEYAKKLADYNTATAAGQATTKPMDPQAVLDQHRPSCLFNAMIHPLAPYTLRGFLWYQGEQNISRPEEYRLELSTLITDWRKRFGQDDLPFYFVQLSSFSAPMDKTRDGYARLREAQLQTAELPNTGIAVTIDIGTPQNVHPHDKQDVGKRLALIAEAKTYGVACEWSGPSLQTVTREQGGIRLKFDHADGLTNRAADVSSFEIAGQDGKYSPADAVLDGGSILLKVADAARVQSVRYAWANAPQATLFNGAGLPASPFRYTLSK